jgi:hypothetical protein
LIVPDDLAIDNSGNVYVGQAANRGVSVFRVVHEAASPSQGSNEATPSRVEKKARRSRVERKARTSRAAKKSRSSRVRKQASPSRVDKKAGPSRRRDTKPTIAEKPERTIGEDVSEPVEFIVDQGADTPSSDADDPDWILIESDQPDDEKEGE